MKVFKFGGASVKDAWGVKNAASIIKGFAGENILIVVSAMGKTTNALEEIAELGYSKKEYGTQLEQLRSFHDVIRQDLNLPSNPDYFIDLIIEQLESDRTISFPQYYDKVVCIGELISSTLLSKYLNALHIENEWLDARDVIKTDETWREANVDWEETEKNIASHIPPILKNKHVVTQGFIGRSYNGNSTTLGREGSDYTGAIFANCLNAEGLWIWKDVQGVFTADPKLFPDAVLLPELTYYEAIEMTYNGARVIHPKTLHPLKQKQIPLFVRSFLEPESEGTIIQSDDKQIFYPPIVVMKQNQVLMSIRPSDLSFVAEEHLRVIYSVFATYHLKINLIQIAALSVSVVVDENKYKIEPVLNELNKLYAVKQNEGLELLTIRHFNEHILFKLTENKEILIEQWTRNTVQFLYR